MFIDKEHFEGWMQRLMSCLERIESRQPLPEKDNRPLMPNGDKLLDNFDLCMMLNVSKRTLQRYRASGDLPSQMIYHKTLYKESDVVKFIEMHFSRYRKGKRK